MQTKMYFPYKYSITLECNFLVHHNWIGCKVSNWKKSHNTRYSELLLDLAKHLVAHRAKDLNLNAHQFNGHTRAVKIHIQRVVAILRGRGWCAHQNTCLFVHVDGKDDDLYVVCDFYIYLGNRRRPSHIYV